MAKEAFREKLRPVFLDTTPIQIEYSFFEIAFSIQCALSRLLSTRAA